MTDDVCESCKESTNNCAEGSKREREKRLQELTFTAHEKGTSHLSAQASISRNSHSRGISRSVLENYSFPLGLRKVLRWIASAHVLSFKWNVKESVNQKINTLNINNNKSSAQPNPINQFSRSPMVMKIFLVFRKIGLLEKMFVFSENCCLSCWRKFYGECCNANFAAPREFVHFRFMRCLIVCTSIRLEMMVLDGCDERSI